MRGSTDGVCVTGTETGGVVGGSDFFFAGDGLTKGLVAVDMGIGTGRADGLSVEMSGGNGFGRNPSVRAGVGFGGGGNLLFGIESDRAVTSGAVCDRLLGAGLRMKPALEFPAEGKCSRKGGDNELPSLPSPSLEPLAPFTLLSIPNSR